MEVNQEFEKITIGFSEEIKVLTQQTRNLIYKVFPEVVEVVWEKQKIAGFGTGLKKNTEHFCWVKPATKHITFGFNYGSELPDPNNLLEGTGKKFRHFKVKSAKDLANSNFIKILKYSTTHRVPPVSKI